MKLVAISRVRNEVDIIEPFVRHHSELFEQLIILDDGSSDDTLEILRSLKASGLPLLVLGQNEIEYQQSRHMTFLMHVAVDQFGADWVVPLDADEFIETQGDLILSEVLMGCQPHPLLMPWINFVWLPDCEQNCEPNPVLRLRLRLPPRMDLAKVMVPAHLISPRAELAQGNHGLIRDGETIPGVPVPSVQLCHFSIRDEVQYAEKIAIGYLKYAAMPNWDRSWGYHYIDPFTSLLSGGVEELRRRMTADSCSYSLRSGSADVEHVQWREEPLHYRGGPLTINPPRRALIPNLLHYANALANELAARSQGIVGVRAETARLGQFKTAETAAVRVELQAATQMLDKYSRALRATRNTLDHLEEELKKSRHDESLAASKHRILREIAASAKTVRPKIGQMPLGLTLADGQLRPTLRFPSAPRRKRRLEWDAVAQSGLFDADWYLARNPDVAAARVSPFDHFMTHGIAEYRDPHPLFSSGWYSIQMQRHNELPDLPPLLHYLSIGSAKHLSPHPLFDPQYYVATYKEIAQSGIDPLRHFLIQGAHEWRNPHPLIWMQRLVEQPGFDGGVSHNVLVSYLSNPHLFAASSHPLFDAAAYLDENPDVACFSVNPLLHYCAIGWRQGRSPHSVFAGDWYLARNPDVLAADIDPLTHYVRYGAHECRNPHPLFDIEFYCGRYPEARQLAYDPLSDYVMNGLGTKPRETTRKVSAADICSLVPPDVLERTASISAFLDFDHAITKPTGTTHPPTFSVIIPIHDRATILCEAIESVLRQTYQDFELILVTDGSPPETLATLTRYRNHPKIKVFDFPLKSGTAVRARNKGILEASGLYVAFLDSDDLAEVTRLEHTFELFQRTECDVVYGAWRALLDGTRAITGLVDGQIVVSPECDLQVLSTTCVPCQSTVSVRRQVFSKAGYLKPNMQYREDHELWARLAYFGANFRPTNDVLATLRIHPGNNELNFQTSDEFWLKEMTKEYKHRRPIPLKIIFLVTDLGPSGGLFVVAKHAVALMNAGNDVTIVNCGAKRGLTKCLPECPLPVVQYQDAPEYMLDNIDVLCATFWKTTELFDTIKARRKIYFVQSDERLFYADQEMNYRVAKTYRLDVEYIVISEWIGDFLEKEFGKKSFLVPNGIDFTIFKERPNLRSPTLKRVLIEGPISIPWKGVRDAYESLQGIDAEIWVVSSDMAPPEDWKIGRSLVALTPEQMSEVYSSCDVILKMSRVESFCLPALEAMACGCAVVLGEVEGGRIEFAEPNGNCVVVNARDKAAARAAVIELLNNKHKRELLVQNGMATAERYPIEASLLAFQKIVCESVADEQEKTYAFQ